MEAATLMLKAHLQFAVAIPKYPHDSRQDQQHQDTRLYSESAKGSVSELVLGPRRKH